MERWHFKAELNVGVEMSGMQAEEMGFYSSNNREPLNVNEQSKMI